MSVLVTVGAGYIGTHTCVELIQSGYDIVVLDNQCNSKEEALKRAEKIVGKSIPFIQSRVGDKALLNRLFKDYQIDSVIHFAGLKAVEESGKKSHLYFQNNVEETLTLCETMGLK